MNVRQKLERPYRTLNHIEVSRSAILNNFDVLKQASGGLDLIPVLKSNAYGHGLELVSEILTEREFPYIAVDGYFEALRIRKVSKQPVLIMGAIIPENFQRMKFKDSAFVIQDEVTLEALAATGKRAKVHIEINTGMNRQGIEPEELDHYLDLIGQYKNIELDGVMTHLADADNTDNAFTEQQVKQFDDLIEQVHERGFEPRWIHIANAPGAPKVKSRFANAFRPGIAVYGVSPLEHKDQFAKAYDQLKPALELKSTVIKIRDLEPGDTISYNRTFKAKEKMSIGVLPVGYYEGVPRSLSNEGVVKFGNQFLPIVGRVCMNHLMVDLKGAKAKVGDEITVISGDRNDPNSIEKLCDNFYFFTYGLLVKLSKDVRRVIVD